MRSLFSLMFQPAGQLMGLVSGTQKALGAADRVQRRPRVDELERFQAMVIVPDDDAERRPRQRAVLPRGEAQPQSKG